MIEANRVLAFALTTLVCAGLGFAIDLDGDGLSNGRELMLETSGVKGDSDGDGLNDADEWRRGFDPLNPDLDGDGVLDGAERAVLCVRLRDCDGDGLADGLEQVRFDALDPDTYDVGLSDAVVHVFEQGGQPASADADRDGIPDGWEESEGRITWGPFNPQPGVPDLLIEFVRVEGPHSGRFSLDFDPAYEAVASMFAQRGIQMQWIETVVGTQDEVRPGFLDTDDIGYYDGVLQSGVASGNPFVTTIVLNPQQTQEDLAGDILGAAFLRSMIATVDYGAHTVFEFVRDTSQGLRFDGTLRISPVLESHVIGARPEQARLLAFASEGIVELCPAPCANDFWFVTKQKQSNGNPDLLLRWTWQPDWFVTAPNITTSDGAYLQLRMVDVNVNHAQLASTIAHEIGHTLGLCHSHEQECYSQFDASDINRAAIDSSTMSYSSAPGTLHFLPSEWRQLETYLTCPPQEPLVLVAEGASAQAVRESKYLNSFVEASQARQCGDASSIQSDLEESTLEGELPYVWLAVYALGSLGALAIVHWRV